MLNNPTSHDLLQLLSITMVDANILVKGGLFYNHRNNPETNYRNARRVLQRLYKRGYANFKQYQHSKLYFPTKSGLEILGKTNQQYHNIGAGKILNHDKTTALFLVHLFRWNYWRNANLRWHPPLPLEEKVCDGAVVYTQDGREYALVLETDNDSHKKSDKKSEMLEKLRAYFTYIPNDQLRFLFIVSSKKRDPINRQKEIEKDVQMVLAEKKLESCAGQIHFICPDSLTSDSPCPDNLRF